MENKMPVSADFDTSTQGSKSSTDYGEQAALHMIGEEFDDLLDLLNDAPEAVGLQALRNIKQLGLIYSNLTSVESETTIDVMPESAIVHSGY